ncbi:unnamed protein product, partial [Darwinula stevensoni]
MHSSNDPLIKMRAITKQYGEGEAQFFALKGVDVDIHEGEFVAIMGPSGSGKSTFANLLGFLDRPTSGAYYFKGRDMANLDNNERALIRRHYIGYIFQGFYLLARTSSQENVELPLLYRGVAAKERKDRALAALALVGLQGKERNTPAQLSGGQQQRVAIARALVTDPLILLADEPTGNLDSERSQEVMEFLQNLNQTRKITIVMVTHEPEMAAFADRIIHFVDGNIQTLREIRRNLMRAFLTTLGIVIGVSSVITMVTLGNGATQSITTQVQSLGSNLIMIRPIRGMAGTGGRSGGNFKMSDVEAIKALPNINAVAPTIQRSARAIYQQNNWSTTVVGTTPDYLTVGAWQLESGRLFTDSEARVGKALCIIGQ